MLALQLREALSLVKPAFSVLPELNRCLLHTSVAVLQKGNAEFTEPQKWPSYNDVIFPIQTPEEKRRPAYVCHMKNHIKYSPKKMWYIACLVRGMSVDEAVRQLEFVNKKGAVVVRETILEAQELAVKEHNVEFKSNLWVAESFTGKGNVVKGIRRHARARPGFVCYRYCHYFVRLEEGDPPPKDKYYWQEPRDGESLLQNWLSMMRNRKVISSL
ncbi:mitochondrial ribosomal protein L22 [Lycorma delicatula]|uniref:mitochondrial ribosomal protein L22 n=1 Tax=Lycorma delicatula TaxID=130591 RepID=UPI003F50F39C